MRKYFLLATLSFLITGTIHAQKIAVVVNYILSNGPADGKSIFYDGKYKLIWDDFQGKPDNSVDFSALTSSGSGFNLEMHGSSSGTTMVVNVFCSYSKPDSWVKPDKKIPYLLVHEQHHFDLTYIYCQKFIERLRVADITQKNYEKVIGNLYTSTQKELDEEQYKYDSETQHSIVKAKQEEWNKKIDDELAELQK